MIHEIRTDTTIKRPRKRMNQARVLSARLVASTRKNAKLMTNVLVEYNPNRIHNTIKVLKVK